MGLLEKLKNTFFEEEYVEVDEVETHKKNAKKEVNPIAKKVDVVEKQQEVYEPEETASTMELARVASELEMESQADTELLKTEVEIPYFEEEDFVESESIYPESEQKKIYGGDPSEIYQHIEMDSYDLEDKAYTGTKEGKPSFKPTPIISPIYGILDKNYRKEEVIDKKDRPRSYVSRKNVDLDSVRNKAFGGLEEDLKNIGSKVEKNEFPNLEESEENLLYDMTEGTPSVDKVTLADAEEYFEDLGLEYNIDYTDVRHEKITGRRSRITKEDHSESETPSRLEKEVATEVEDTNPETEEDHSYMMREPEETKLEDNLFDLVDSMYEEKE